MRLFTAFTIFILSAAAAPGQNRTVQQPAFGRFGVGTTVVAPDRGAAFLGGVSRARDARSRSGFLPFGSSRGFDRSHSGVSSRVWIHDLRAMDRQALQAGEANRMKRRPLLNGNAAHAYRALTENRGEGVAGTSAPVESRPSVFDGEDPAAKFLQLARRAEQRGRHSLARMHYRMAARHGSAVAREKLRGPQRSNRSTLAD